MTNEPDPPDDATENGHGPDDWGPAALWAADPEVAPEPDYSVVIDERLAAYVWVGEGGELRRAGGRDDEEPIALGFGDLLLFDGEHADALRKLAVASAELDRFRFKVELEGWGWLSGAFQPHARVRRF